MADLLRNAAEWLEQKRTEHMSRTVTYQRGVASVVVSATVGRTLFQLDGAEPSIDQDLEIRDYLILTADLVLGATAVLPQEGDRIVEQDAGKAFTYEVLAPTQNEPAYRYSDQYRLTLRIHTKLIDVETAP